MSISIRSIIIFLFSYTFINLGVIEVFPFLSALRYVSDFLIFIFFFSIFRKKNKSEFNRIKIYDDLKSSYFHYFLTLISIFLHHEKFLLLYMGA